jgi:hypothetical protein
MAKQKKKPVVELNDDINWDYSSYREDREDKLAITETSHSM